MNAQTLSPEAGSHVGAAAQSGVARIKRSYAPPAPVSGTSASNDAAYRTGRDRAAEVDGWARRAAAANGFGAAHAEVESSRSGVDIRTSIAFAPGDSPLLYKTAGMRELAADISGWVVGVTRRYVKAWRRHRMAWDTYKSLRGLDARTLRDVGLDRSEMGSVAAEIAGEADRTRMQALRTLRALSLY